MEKVNLNKPFFKVPYISISFKKRFIPKLQNLRQRKSKNESKQDQRRRRSRFVVTDEANTIEQMIDDIHDIISLQSNQIRSK